MAHEDILKMENIVKIYGNGVLANNNVNFSVRKGEIHALMGENGAGKSTLMKVLFGIEQPDKGKIEFLGEEVKIISSQKAIQLGIGMVHQHFKLVESLTVSENIVLGNEPKKYCFFDKNKANNITKELSKKFNFELNPCDVVKDLSVGKKQKIEILKALYRDVKLLILDEPTAVLTPQETVELFEQLNKLKDNGITIIFISHKLDEIKKICQRITIMRQGKSMGTYDVNTLTTADISKLMVGRDVVLKIDKKKAVPKEVVLQAKNLNLVDENGKKIVNNVSFSVRSGEILGIAGVEGCGSREVVELISGMVPKDKDSIVKLCGEDIGKNSIKVIRKKGLSYIPEDRINVGLATTLSIKENLISSDIESSFINSKILMKHKIIDENGRESIKNYDIRCKDENHIIGMLSGGNMQKVVIAREFSTNPKFLIAEQPTRGVDVGAIEFIHKKIIEKRDEGLSVLLVSADLNEILELSDSVIVMNQGEISGYFEDAKSLTEEELGYYMLGVKRQTDEEIGGVFR